MADLAGRRILVAGGTGTVGRHLVQAQLAAGATVVVPSRQQTKLDSLFQAVAPDERDRLVPLVGDIVDAEDAARILESAGTLDGAIASIGRFVSAPSVLEAKRSDLERALAAYALAHFSAAQSILPALEERGGGYVMINGSLAYGPDVGGTGLVAIAGAAQSMLGRVLMKERAGLRPRINEIVLYSNLRAADQDNDVNGGDIGRYAAFLLSDEGAGVKGQVIHLRSRRDLTFGT